jgi:hypothetical protein
MGAFSAGGEDLVMEGVPQPHKYVSGICLSSSWPCEINNRHSAGSLLMAFCPFRYELSIEFRVWAGKVVLMA